MLGGLCAAAGAALVLPTGDGKAAASSLDQLNILRRRGEVRPFCKACSCRHNTCPRHNQRVPPAGMAGAVLPHIAQRRSSLLCCKLHVEGLCKQGMG